MIVLVATDSLNALKEQLRRRGESSARKIQMLGFTEVQPVF